MRRTLGWLRAVCFAYAGFVLTFIYFVICTVTLVFAPRSARVSHCFVRLWARSLLGAAGLGVRVEGPSSFDPSEVRMIVANHASFLDPPALCLAYPGQARFVLKRELLRLPFVGWYASLAGHFLLDRGSPREGKRILDRAVARAKRYRLNPVVFAEGTRTHDGKLAPFKTGAFQLALSAGIEVQPVAILGTWDRMPRGAPGPSSGGEIIVRVGEPIPVDGLTGGPGRKALSERVRKALYALGVK